VRREERLLRGVSGGPFNPLLSMVKLVFAPREKTGKGGGGEGRKKAFGIRCRE